MLLADSNIWLALAISRHRFHQEALAWFARQKSNEAVVFCRFTQITFVRLLTTNAVFAPYGMPSLSNQLAWSTYERFLADKRIGFVEEPHDLEVHWQELACIDRASPKLWMDAYLAAFAISGKHRFVTTDKAFKQFKKLETVLLPEV